MIKRIAQKLIDNGIEITKENIIKMIQSENEMLNELVDRKTDRSQKAFDIAKKKVYCALATN